MHASLGESAVQNNKEPQANSGAYFFGFPCANCGEPMVFLHAQCGFALSDFNTTNMSIHMQCKSCGHADVYGTTRIQQFGLVVDHGTAQR